jgi:hypothetical protein
MILVTGTIIIVATTDMIAMTDTIATVLVSRTCDSTGIAAIATSLAPILKRVMIAITIKRQSIMSCTITLAPEGPTPSLVTALTQSLVAHCRDPGLRPLPGPWRITTWTTKRKQALINSRELTCILTMKMTIFTAQSRTATAFMLPLSLQQARSPKRQDARLRRMPHQQKMFFCFPSFVNVPSMEVDQELTDVQPISFSVNK